MNLFCSVASAYAPHKSKKGRREFTEKVIKAAVIVLLLVTAVVLLLLSGLFSIKNIEITGAERFGENEIRNYVSSYSQMNGFRLLLQKNAIKDVDKALSGHLVEIEEKLLFEFPYLKDVCVKYSFPNTLKVTVSERNAVLFIAEYDDYICVDEEGFVVDIMSKAEYEEFRSTDEVGGTSLVKGISSDEYMLGKALRGNDDGIVHDTIRLCTVINEDEFLRGKIDFVDVSLESEIYLTALPGLVVDFGSFEGMYEKIVRLSAIFAQGYSGESNGTIDFTTGGHDVFRPGDTPDTDTGDGNDNDLETEQ